jgi:hypothetical protein
VTDTPDYIRKKQLEIWLSKSVAERFKLGFELIDAVNQQTLDRIKQQNPKFSEGDLKAEFIRQMYKDELDPDYLQDVMEWVKQKYREKKS